MSYAEWLGSGVAGAIAVGDDWDRPVIDGVRQNIKALAARRAVYPLGGSRRQLIVFNGTYDAEEYIDVELDGTEFQTGATVRARVEVRSANAGTSITPKIRNVTDSTDAVVGAACTASDADYSGSNQKQTLSFTPASGVKKYRLQFTNSNATNGAYGAPSYLEVFF
jgi:hypothetical protein